MTQRRIHVDGMHCASCASLVKDAVQSIPGVRSCELDPKTGGGTIEHDEPFDADRLKKEVESLGYRFRFPA